MVIVITGPIASGKSSVARALARELSDMGVRSAVIDLDDVAGHRSSGGSTPGGSTPDGSAPGASDWTLARRESAARANVLQQDGVAVVIADGSYNTPFDRATFEEGLQTQATPVYVTLQVSFEEALRRAQGDPSRGRSRDPEFLGSYFAGRRDVPATPTDLVIDTEQKSAVEAAATIAGRLQPKDIP